VGEKNLLQELPIGEYILSDGEFLEESIQTPQMTHHWGAYTPHWEVRGEKHIPTDYMPETCRHSEPELARSFGK
jgi:hypothetical protein